MLLRFPKQLFSANYLPECACHWLYILVWGESVLECQDMWRGQWVKYCMVRLDGCEVAPAGLDKAGGGILLPQDGPGMGMCV